MNKSITIKGLEKELQRALDDLAEKDNYEEVYSNITEGYESLGYSVNTDTDDVMYVYYYDEDIDEEHNDGYITLRRINLLEDKELLDALDDIKERNQLLKNKGA